ncbi:hypothetical protein CJ030_MR2G024432 [Morella rubra]|uniref:Uncharacterized protein n=1 Tax=Morella rubra TaxID=262757 RepID=A0A6A1WH27_9ROSI|nr:hypothetical protein CJ030_MR2G024463 [Morella rubra]KAB1224163.1 hypothetical protein CJ030_MR2G024432 [Morella rubra]
MEDSEGQPLPPGVHSLPNYSHNQAFSGPSAPRPPQLTDNTSRPQYHSNYPGNYLFPRPSNSTFTPTQSSYPHICASIQHNFYPSAPDLSGRIPESSENSNAPQLGFVARGADLIGQQPEDKNGARATIPLDENKILQRNCHVDGSDGTSTSYSRLHVESAGDIETAARDAVLREQTWGIYNFREARGAGGPSEEGKDIFSERHDPNALKDHLLKMTSQHRAEMAMKWGKPTVLGQGRAHAAAAGFEKRIDHDFEPVLSMTPLN